MLILLSKQKQKATKTGSSLSKDGCITIGICPLGAFTSCQHFKTWQPLQDKVTYLAQERKRSSLVNAKEGEKEKKPVREVPAAPQSDAGEAPQHRLKARGMEPVLKAAQLWGRLALG